MYYCTVRIEKKQTAKELIYCRMYLQSLVLAQLSAQWLAQLPPHLILLSALDSSAIPAHLTLLRALNSSSTNSSDTAQCSL
jgi:hypothetical protein